MDGAKLTVAGYGEQVDLVAVTVCTRRKDCSCVFAHVKIGNGFHVVTKQQPTLDLVVFVDMNTEIQFHEQNIMADIILNHNTKILQIISSFDHLANYNRPQLCIFISPLMFCLIDS